ncbi:protein SICKLE-like isoform X1 [Tripterygium wilfordii]|uniref:protein SICKLE-like isoform X1 n=1 Tax=Tripterygium wilfordii TaxID=458696 RepID=UPI0018F83459|nr:protein SICKLE-like isoform X1 [Tripterygium wilfordii]
MADLLKRGFHLQLKCRKAIILLIRDTKDPFTTVALLLLLIKCSKAIILLIRDTNDPFTTVALLLIKTQQEWAVHFLHIMELHLEVGMDQAHSFNVVCIFTAIVLELLLLQNRSRDRSTCPSHYSPHQRHQRPVHYSGFTPHRSPAGMGSPFPMLQGTTPGGWNRPGSIPNYGFPSNAGAGTLAPGSDAYGPGVVHGQSRGHWLGTSPKFTSGHGGTHISGRGIGYWHGSSMSPGSGRSGGRGRGFHPRGLQPDRTLGPERFYNKSMVEDPWQHLKPVIWKSLDTPGSSNSWLPKSISMKKARVPEAPNKTNSQRSLAEYLAASFDEAVNDAAGV